MNKIKILFLAANPTATSQLQLDEEIRAITEEIRKSEYRDALHPVSAWAVRPGDLLQLLNMHKPQIVHFSGHGSPTGEIFLTDDCGDSKPISAKAIKTLFTVLKDNIHLVILNACYSKSQAKAIAKIIDCTIGMNDAIGDRAAIIFAAAFYRAIGYNCSVQQAFNQAKTALLLEGIPEETVPTLLVRKGVYPSQLFLSTKNDETNDTLESLRHSAKEHLSRQKVIQQTVTGNQNIFSGSGDVTVSVDPKNNNPSTPK